jgi:hypothetical protein
LRRFEAASSYVIMLIVIIAAIVCFVRKNEDSLARSEQAAWQFGAFAERVAVLAARQSERPTGAVTLSWRGLLDRYLIAQGSLLANPVVQVVARASAEGVWLPIAAWQMSLSDPAQLHPRILRAGSAKVNCGREAAA